MKTGNDIFLDSNIVLYLHDEGFKYEKARQLLVLKPTINTQVVAEYANVCLRKYKFGKPQLAILVKNLIANTVLISSDSTTFSTACDIMLKYDFQFFDSIIVVSALEAKCKILYSEDLQHGQVIENKLTILNPFVEEN